MRASYANLLVGRNNQERVTQIESIRNRQLAKIGNPSFFRLNARVRAKEQRKELDNRTRLIDEVFDELLIKVENLQKIAVGLSPKEGRLEENLDLLERAYVEYMERATQLNIEVPVSDIQSIQTALMELSQLREEIEASRDNRVRPGQG